MGMHVVFWSVGMPHRCRMTLIGPLRALAIALQHNTHQHRYKNGFAPPAEVQAQQGSKAVTPHAL
jgi:hypothetical protein